MTHPHHIEKYESMIFNAGTTLKTDFNDGEIIPIPKTVYKEKSVCKRIRPPPLKDLHSLTEWRVPNVPFTLFIKPHDIVHMNPMEIQKAYERPPNLERENVQKSRPRIIMTPFVSMDDFQGPEERQRLVDDFYTSETSRVSRKVQEVIPRSVRAPFSTGLPAPANPITLPGITPPYVSPEWRMDSVSWDSNQVRSYANPTRKFWLGMTTKCQECDNTAARERLKKLRRH